MNHRQEIEAPDHVRYSRGLNLRPAIVRGLGVMIFLSAFILIGQTAAIAGPWMPLSFFLAILLLAPNVLTYAELAVSVPCSGGVYVQSHESQGGWLAFLTGWLVVIASLAVGVTLAQGFAVQITTLLSDQFNLTIAAWPWAIGLIVLSSINNALGTQEARQGLLILLLLSILLGFVLFAAPGIQIANYSVEPPPRPAPPANTSRPGGEQALTLLLVLFVGIEVTTNFQGERCHHDRNLPRALLITLLLAALITTGIAGVAIGVLGADVLADSRIPLALLGTQIAQGAGRPLILVIGALALALAFKHVFLLAVRQIYRMSQDGYYPAGLGKIHPHFHTPVWIITLIAVLQLPLVSLSPVFLGELAGLLYLLVMMSSNLTLLRREQMVSGPFTLPFHPWVPGLTLAIDVLVSLLWRPLYFGWAAVLTGLGILFYLIYARSHYIKAQEGTIVFKPPPQEEDGKDQTEVTYRVMVPIANPATANTLLRLAGVLAQQKGGVVLAIQIVTIPDQIPLEEGRQRARVSRLLLERAVTQAQEEEFEIRTISRVARDVAQGILDTAREENVDLIVLGWRGSTYSFGASMGPIIDAVIRDAPCDVIVAKGDEWRTVKKILLPTAGGPHAPIAARLATLIARAYHSEVTALYIQLGRATPEQMEKNRQRLAHTLRGLEFDDPPEQKIIISDSVIEGVVQEAQGYDMVLLGASEEGLFDQFVFGSIPQKIAARVPNTAIIARRYRGVTEFWVRRLMRSLYHTFPSLNVEEQLELREEMSRSAQPGINFFVLIILSIVIATLGLLLDSAAIVIGAMLVAPLMSPILAFSLGMVLGDVRLVRLSAEAVFKGVALSILLAVSIGILSPFKGLTAQILSRTQPTLLDLAVALASGMAGAYALARKDVSAALPGVAIAAALMPPLGVAGLGLSLGKPHIAGGAFLLFITNIAAISLAGVLVFIVLGIRPQTWQPDTGKRIRRSVLGFTLALILIAIPLGVIMSGIIQDTRTQETIRAVLQDHAALQGGTLIEFEYHSEPDDNLAIVAIIRSTKAADQPTVDATADALRQRLTRPVTLELVVLPVTRSGDQ